MVIDPYGALDQAAIDTKTGVVGPLVQGPQFPLLARQIAEALVDSTLRFDVLDAIGLELLPLCRAVFLGQPHLGLLLGWLLRQAEQLDQLLANRVFLLGLAQYDGCLLK